MARHNLLGRQFGQLTVIEELPLGWLCECLCGERRAHPAAVLNAGRVQSCGCRRRTLKTRRTHGYSGTRTYRVWTNMHARCRDPERKNYAGRGIKVCDRWSSFENFLADMGEAPDGLTLERKDVNGDYNPDNCCWATQTEQQNNKRSNTVIEHEGRSMTLAQWSRELGVTVSALCNRLRKHGTIFTKVKGT